MVTVTINGQQYQVPEDVTILEACRMNNIDLPTFCYDDDFTLSVPVLCWVRPMA
jgi:NADP-reducing hydrogenase subunit HndD